MKLKTIILAAGQGTRMKSSLPKVLHKLGGFALLEHVFNLAASLGCEETSVIYGHGGERVPSELGYLNANWVEQKQQLGTGHAVMQVADSIGDDQTTVLVLYGDVPLLRKATVQNLLDRTDENTLALLTIDLDDPFGYGRIVRNPATNRIARIVEEKDASESEKRLTEVNTGIVAVPGNLLRKWLSELKNDNAQGEYYLTDIIALAVRQGCRVESVRALDPEEVLGINDRVQLAYLERVYQRRQAVALMTAGVTLKDPERFDLRGQIVQLGRDVEIDIDVILEGRISLGDSVRIGSNCVIRNTRIGDYVEVLPYSLIEGAEIGDFSRVGPFARIRPETEIADHVHVGNFVEIKKSCVGSGSKINHLSYIGDATIGTRVNIGAGTITCNYDGVNKYRTVIEDEVFVGSDTQLVAPVTVRKRSTIGAGSTITKDTPEDQLTLSRSKQCTIKGWVRPKKRSA
ncbi:MAG: bifunctional UDP-N-acetylglucosamine diphosphorylase/glucosamine-1-phosphate N-acetyltransferase GlmU [Methylococcaceae bacterium]|nr:bifunctional UDP-N-acetylglucosamine diphosphorylase/glucosamine-1-phosphate N-acetyltransferase GlmU [Methylococcaceae bacterium]MCI0733831.1 bifunctional UDP-N-acetylglucosamine diphosphorylase/glucosamine-1-phosphate N-acetyltransferase GlmU [Methylococcaceae bacterium]